MGALAISPAIVVLYRLLQSLKKTFITTGLTAVKKNKQPTHTPGGPGRLRSWSGPVDPEFQGRLRFSYDPGMPGTATATAGLEKIVVEKTLVVASVPHSRVQLCEIPTAQLHVLEKIFSALSRESKKIFVHLLLLIQRWAVGDDH
jgi:hypothetical protein